MNTFVNAFWATFNWRLSPSNRKCAWYHSDMETLSALLALCERGLVDFPHKGPVMSRFDVDFM